MRELEKNNNMGIVMIKNNFFIIFILVALTVLSASGNTFVQVDAKEVQSLVYKGNKAINNLDIKQAVIDV